MSCLHIEHVDTNGKRGFGISKEGTKERTFLDIENGHGYLQR